MSRLITLLKRSKVKTIWFRFGLQLFVEDHLQTEVAKRDVVCTVAASSSCSP